jgi:dihydrofolate reductase
LDGFIARKNGDIDWLPSVDTSGEDFGYKEFISSVDQLVMGRHTFEKVLTFDTWPYLDKKVIVLSSGNPIIPNDLMDKVEVLNLTPGDLLGTLTEKGCRHIYLDGGRTIQLFLKEGLVDEMTITTIPILIGDGLPLFGPLQQDVKFQLMASKFFNNGFVQNKYKGGK